MASKRTSSKLQTEAIIVGYAMSRLDSQFLAAQRVTSWRIALERASRVLHVPASSLKNLRDEFDPFHSNPRKGWRNRPLRPSRQRVLSDLCDVSDDALLECVNRILSGDKSSADEIVESIQQVSRPAYNVAERLLTGRLAEEFFLARCQDIVGIARRRIVDHRFSAIGFDFGVRGRPEHAIEVKGIKRMKGALQFTDCEWGEAKARQKDYWLVVVGNLEGIPQAKVWRDPHASLDARCRYQTSLTASWISQVSL
jgi:hypothetical protein